MDTALKVVFGLGGVALVWWAADHIAIDRGGSGLSFPFRTEADKNILAQRQQKAQIAQLGQGLGQVPQVPR
jgi:hypothetical protein